MVESYIICIAFVVYGIVVALFLYFCIKCEPSKPTGPIRLPYVVSKKPQNKISDSEENQLSKSRPSAAGLSYIVSIENMTPPSSSPDRIWTISNNSLSPL